jgi:hypothetical protein
MKIKINIFLLVLLWSNMLLSQTQPTGTPISVPQNSNPQNNQAWFRGGNLPGGTGGSNNIFGTNWNSPIYTVTNGTVRTRLNGALAANINGVNQNVTGFFGIGLNGYFANNSPMAMLHLEGPNNTPGYTGNGWRRWMQTGTFMRENSDAMYVG